MKNYIKIVSVIIGTVIGAGFASGREIFLFFGSYGLIYGILGMLLSSFLTSIIIYRAFCFLTTYDIHHYQEFLDTLLPSTSSLLKNVLANIINIFLLFSFFIMISGFGAYFKQQFSISPLWGILLILFFCYITFQKRADGITKINSILIPLLILFILGIALQCTLTSASISSVNLSISKKGNWILDAILYSSYNSILLIPILITLKDYLKNKKSILTVSILSGSLLFLLSLAIYISLLKIDIPIMNIEIPTLYLTSKLGSFQNYGYGLVLLVAIFTSAISAGFSFLKNFENSGIQNLILFFMCIGSFLLSPFSFSSLVNILYPFFGYLGIIQIFLLLLKKKAKTDINGIKDRRKKWEKC